MRAFGRPLPTRSTIAPLLATLLAGCQATSAPLDMPPSDDPDAPITLSPIAAALSPAAPDLSALEMMVIEAPAPPASPMLSPCPTGWQERRGTIPFCEPWPEGQVVCPEGYAQFAGAVDCRLVSDACPAGMYAEPPPNAIAVINVTQTMTREQVNSAIAMAPPGSAILLPKGMSFNGPLAIGNRITLLGACAERTVITNGDPKRATLEVTVPGVTIKNLRLEGGDVAIAFLPHESGARVAVEGVIVTNVGTAFSSDIRGATLELRQVHVHDVQNALSLAQANAVIDRAVFERTGGEAVYIHDGATAHLTGVAIHGSEHFGLYVDDAEVTLDQVVLQSNASGGVIAQKGSIVTVRDAMIRNNAGEFGGVAALDSTLTVERAMISRNDKTAIYLFGATGSISDVLLEDSRLRDDQGGFGLWASRSVLDFSRSVVSKNREVSVAAVDSQVELHDVTIQDTDFVVGPGAGLVGQNSTVDGERVSISGSRGLGMVVDARSSSTFTDLSISDTRAFGPGGLGILVQEESMLNLTRASVLQSAKGAIWLFAHARAALDQIHIAEPGETPADDARSGTGIYAFSSSRIEGQHLLIERTMSGGIGAEDGAEVALTNAIIRDVALHPRGAGGGAKASVGARFDLDHVLIERVSSYGVAFSSASGILRDVAVRDVAATEHGQGIGISLAHQASASIERTAIERAALGVGLFSGASAMVFDLRASGSVSDHVEGGRGLELVASSLTGGRIALDGNHGGGLSAWGSTIDLEDLTVRDTVSGVRRFDGMGLELYHATSATVRRASLQGNRAFSVIAGDEGSTLDLSDAIIRDTLEPACVSDPSGCGHAKNASGIAAHAGGVVRVERFEITGSADAALQIYEGGAIDAHDGLIAENLVGSNVQVAEYDRGRVTEKVIYRDNGSDLGNMSLPLPERSAMALPE